MLKTLSSKLPNKIGFLHLQINPKDKEMLKKNESRKKTLFSEKWLDVIEINGMVGIHNKYMSIAIMPYIVNEHGMVPRIS